MSKRAWESISKEEQIIGCLMMISGLLLVPYSYWCGWAFFYLGVSDHITSIIIAIYERRKAKVEGEVSSNPLQLDKDEGGSGE